MCSVYMFATETASDAEEEEDGVCVNCVQRFEMCRGLYVSFVKCDY